MAEQSRAQLDVDAVGRVGEEVGPQPAQDNLEHRQRGQAQGEDLQCRHAAVNEHLVDDDLEEERREEAEDLQEE